MINWPLTLSILVFGLATGLAVYMAARDDAMLELGVPDETDAESDEVTSAIYHDEILPAQVAAHEDLVLKLRRVAKELAASKPEGITADDIHAVCPIPPGVDPRIMGAAFERGKWVKRGWVASSRKETHGRPVRIWTPREVAA